MLACRLKIAGISSRKLPDPNEGSIENHYLYNDKELFEEADLDWYDYGFRNYDAQIGRFMQLDPLTDEYPELTPYQYASCEPIANIDMDGLEKLPATFVTEAGEKAWVTGKSLLGAAFTSGVIPKAASSGGFWNWVKTTGKSIGRFLGDEVVPRLGGVLKTLVSLPVMVLGAATSELGVGVPVFLAGADYGQSGLQQIWDGNTHETITEKILQDFAMPKEDAAFMVDATIGAVSLSGDIKPQPLTPPIIKPGKTIFNSPPIADDPVLPNSGSIMKSLGAASKAEMLARKLNMNISSATTR